MPKLPKKRAVVPCHRKDLPKGTVISILREAGVIRKQLEDILNKN